MTPVITVVVPTYQRRDLLEKTLQGLSAQSLPAEDFEVIVVDDASSDGTDEVLREWSRGGPGRVVIVHERNAGAAAARNTGTARASAPIVAFTDDDCVPEPQWLERGLEALRSPEVSVVQGATVPDPAVPIGRWPRTMDVTSLSGLYESCNIFYRREELVAAGGFDAALRWYCEDIITARTVLRRGGEAVFAADAVVVHDVSHPGFRAHLRRSGSYRNWPAAVRECPELRDELLWHRWFLRARSAGVLALGLALVAIGAGLLTRRGGLATAGLVLAIAVLARRAPRTTARHAWVDAGLLLIWDIAIEAALVKGSIQHRTVVL